MTDSERPNAMSKLIEKEAVQLDYGFPGVNAIVRHNGDLLLVTNGFGGQADITGGAGRWKHGCAYKLRDGDTLNSLHHGECNDIPSNWEILIAGYDDSRPALNWSGHAIDALAEKLDP